MFSTASTAPLPPLCALCNAQPAKYTCPRCRTKSCSVPCSRAHKATTGCSGERDRTAFLPMNEYGYSTLVSDYVFLEDVGRRVESWGREIVRGGIVRTAVRGMSMRGERGRARGKGRTFGHGHDKRSYLAMQMGFRDIDMDILPAGMERAKRNQSFWDSKRKAALFTVEFNFHPPPDTRTRQEVKPISLVTNRNDWERTIRSLIHTSIKSSQKAKKDDALLQWLSLDDEDDTIPSSVLCLMKRPKMLDDSPNLNSGRPSYYKLDWHAKLSSALRQKQFVEFPTILLVDESSFKGVLVNDNGAEEDLQERRLKRRKLDPMTAKKTISGLVGAYGSDDEDEQPNVLDTLGNYSGSEGTSDDKPEPDVDEVENDGSDDINVEGHAEDFRDILDAVALPERAMVIEDEDEEESLDWGDDEIAEDEEKLGSLTAGVRHRHFTSFVS